MFDDSTLCIVIVDYGMRNEKSKYKTVCQKLASIHL